MSNIADIRGLMQFRNGQIATLTLTPNEKKEPTASLKISAELTPHLAEIMRCRWAVFDADGKPHPQVTRLDLGGVILRDVDFSLPSPTSEGSYDVYRPEDIASFRIHVDGMIARLEMLVRIKTRYEEVLQFFVATNTGKFEFAIRALQDEFDWSGAGGKGERVSLSPPANQDGSGEAETKGPLFVVGVDLSEKADFSPDRLAIPDVREMGIRRNRKQGTRVDITGPTDAEIQSSMSPVEIQ